MRSLAALFLFFASLPVGNAFGQPEPRSDYAEFSKLLHSIAVKQLPKQFEDNSGWGKMAEVPPNIKLAGLRKLVKVGDRTEAPHGPWYRFKGKVEDPDKNLKIVVRDFKKMDDKSYRIVIDVDATIMCQAEWQQWQRGLMLVGMEFVADANITAKVVCDVGVSANFTKLPPELKIEPKVAELELDMTAFNLRDGLILKGERAKNLSSDMKEMMRGILKSSEPMLRDAANQAIADGIRQGKGTISAGTIMKALPKPNKN